MHRAVGVHDEAAVGLVVEQDLSDAEHHERIQSATDDGENQRDHHGAAKFSKKIFHRFFNHGLTRIDTDDNRKTKSSSSSSSVLVIEAAPNRGRGSRIEEELKLQIVFHIKRVSGW